jgi:hypothetical protein
MTDNGRLLRFDPERLRRKAQEQGLSEFDRGIINWMRQLATREFPFSEHQEPPQTPPADDPSHKEDQHGRCDRTPPDPPR